MQNYSSENNDSFIQRLTRLLDDADLSAMQKNMEQARRLMTYYLSLIHIFNAGAETPHDPAL